MIETILKAAGLPFRQARYADPPAGTYAVYFDEVTADGPDGINRIFIHDITVELYEPRQDVEAEAAIEAAIDAQGRPWAKQSRYWLKSINRYQVIYEFSYIEKRRN
jgi:hypothetical protein